MASAHHVLMTNYRYLVFFVALFVGAFLFVPNAEAALIGHWSFDQADIDWSTSTGQIHDLSGNGNNGTAYNLSIANATSGQVGGALQFNGSNSYISIPAKGSFPPSGNSPRTVCMWFKPTVSSWTPSQAIFGYGVGGDAFGIDMDNFPQIQFYTWHNDLFVDMGIAGHQEDWLQICWVWNGVDTSLLYSNGVLRGSNDFNSSINTPQTAVNIGQSGLGDGYFPGVIDDVRIYDTAFTANDIESLYDEATDPVFISDLASSTTETTATITWDTSTSSNSTLWYGTSSGNYTMSSSSAVTTVSHSVTVTELTSFTTYYFIAVSNDGFGNVSTSSEKTFTTTDITAPNISNVTATSIATTSVSVIWNTIYISSTRLSWGLTADLGTLTSETDTSPRVTSHSRSLSGLLSCTTYYFAAVSRDAAGNTATSSTQSFTTLGCAGHNATSTVSTSTTISAGTSATSSVETASKTFSVAATATTSSLVIQVRAVPSAGILADIGRPDTASEEVGVTVFDVKAIIDGTTVLDSFDHPVTITYEYTDEEVAGLNESTLKLYHYHNGAWAVLDDCTVDAGVNVISCTTDSFSIFGLFGSELIKGSHSVSGVNVPQRINYLVQTNQLSSALDMLLEYISRMYPADKRLAAVSAVAVRDLEYGMAGADVNSLQKLLIEQNTGRAAQELAKHGATLWFGPLTRDALIEYQAANAIIPTIGYFGSTTRAQMKGKGIGWW